MEIECPFCGAFILFEYMEDYGFFCPGCGEDITFYLFEIGCA